MLIDHTLPSFLDALSSADPTPGGGSAAALVGATGAALLTMVVDMPKTRSGTPEARAALDEVRPALQQARQTLLTLVDRDAAAYDLVVDAFRLPKGTDEEKAARRAAIQQATRAATETPLDTLRVCVDTMRAGQASIAHGNPSAASDVKVGYRLLFAAAMGAKDNVEINLGGLADDQVRTAFQTEADGLAAEAARLHERAVANRPA